MLNRGTKNGTYRTIQIIPFTNIPFAKKIHRTPFWWLGIRPSSTTHTNTRKDLKVPDLKDLLEEVRREK